LEQVRRRYFKRADGAIGLIDFAREAEGTVFLNHFAAACEVAAFSVPALSVVDRRFLKSAPKPEKRL
jgi:hypothetical protein